MSISTIQEKLLGKGCGVFISVVMAVIMAGFVFNNCSRGSQLNNPHGGDDAEAGAVVTVGDQAITEEQITQAATEAKAREDQEMAQQKRPPLADNYDNQAYFAMLGLRISMNKAAMLVAAQKAGVPLTEDAYLAAAKNQIQQMIDQVKGQMSYRGKLKPNATPQDVDKAFKADPTIKKTTEEILASGLSNAKALLENPQEGQKLKGDLLPQIVIDFYSKQITPTDAELKAGYDNYQIKQILIAQRPGVKVDAKVQQVQDALKGGMSFEDAMDKFSDAPAMGKGKKKSESVTNMPAQFIDSNPDYKGLKGQKVGYVSAPTVTNGGTAIYKLTGMKSDVPKDFDTNKQMYVAQYTQPKASAKFQDQTKQILASSTKWNNAGYKELNEYGDAMLTPGTNQTSTLSKIEDEAKATISTGQPAERAPATYAYYLANKNLYSMAGPNKDKMIDQRIDVLNQVLTSSEDPDLRMELVDLYIQKKDGPGALTNLIAAAKNNADYDTNGQRRFGDIQAKAMTLVSKGLVKEADLKDFNAVQDAWKTQKIATDKQQADEAKAAIEQAKADAAQEKANEEAVKKQKAQSGGKSSATPNLLPPSNPAPQQNALTTGGLGH